MAFTEAQILAGGGVIANKSVPAKPKKQTASPQPSAPSANYSESVHSEKSSALKNQLPSGTAVSNGQLTEYNRLPVYKPGEVWNFGNNVSVKAQNSGYEIFLYDQPKEWVLSQGIAFSAARSFEKSLPTMGSFHTGQGTALFTPPSNLTKTSQNSANLAKLQLFNQ